MGGYIDSIDVRDVRCIGHNVVVLLHIEFENVVLMTGETPVCGWLRFDGMVGRNMKPCVKQHHFYLLVNRGFDDVLNHVATPQAVALLKVFHVLRGGILELDQTVAREACVTFFRKGVCFHGVTCSIQT